MKIILTMAVSANGIIASKSGSEDFLSHTNWIQFVSLAKRIGCFIWGRKTYEAVIKWEGDYLTELEGVKKIIVSTSNLDLKNGFTLANSPEQALETLESEGFNEAIITGGSTLNSEFAKRGLINEVIFDVNPSILGEGIPVFSLSDFELKLELMKVEKIDDGIVELHYRVKK
ncbi:MAG: Bifunctional deaminase-reductase domain protein [Candidatus Daviesbacteria bacterium GW2011_GWA1_41_61]|uniref:Bifunctional deaminase-reductase domain protein n=1 Tax=Candidatus Daviesbacteria bacterium GW2011_GWA2_40_9 TaxID=1618424 RepID=A0A0G0U8T3_9BACT|nr:MAG: Bifunctional deaminase-reductase domain protein [Candidatus Daviesbacteria bacterium GW2011_GWC1_40_9]KKR83641.1 MAG: Bifunctional deaminase-reductase domain protein [Candidatus Daviesbacteria bacterium GW2011_GWA2_40_9]KKR92700.1 MAG: Bifunctional deaminase-reductase domain protein [Candidatus Daviesbacteria bacterium GW2011_GWB1_41_15]KKS14631.1 MAG: Bifunctional deaminase-reductase domain protein [Candidatus Daviesbacteria bacterium GW2011_GWA1_41_61]